MLIGIPDIQSDHIYVPMRDLYEAAESRRYVVRQRKQKRSPRVAGGLVHTKSMSRGTQEYKLAEMLYRLLFAIANAPHNFPLTFINYPRLVRDSYYLYRKLESLMSGIPFKRFDSVFKSLIREDWIHDFRSMRGKRE